MMSVHQKHVKAKNRIYEIESRKKKMPQTVSFRDFTAKQEQNKQTVDNNRNRACELRLI